LPSASARRTIETFDVAGLTTPETPYPSATRFGEFVFVSGQVSYDDVAEILAPGDPYLQTLRAIARLDRELAERGGRLRDVVQATVYLAHAGDAAPFNLAWREAFGVHRPSRATVVGALLDPRLLVEVQAIAVVRGGEAA
jgi:2-iminobutanoate/2-iminopropanoate deaminase